ncbi:MAG: hypothetical protein ACYTCN_09680 [Planctomycetota bacterium]|jgi:hypothetical protein
MMKKFWFFVLLFCAPVVYAQQDYPRDITLSWTNADSYTDGTAIESGDLTGVRIECFRQNETTPILTGTFPPTGEGAAQTETFSGAIPQPGTYTCFGYSIVIGGIESDPSSPAQKKYVGKPRAPATWTIEG